MLLAEQRLNREPVNYQPQRPGSNPGRRRRQSLKVLRAIIISLLSLVVVNLVIQALVIQRDHEVSSWQSLINAKEREIIKTRVAMADLESYDRIQDIAKNELGMRVAGANDYRCIAAVPVRAPETYAYLAQNHVAKDLWAQLTAWIGGSGATMAQTP